jgi:hypothetical protein
MTDSLADEAARLIKEAQEYMLTGPIYWDAPLKMHVVDIVGTPVSVADLAALLRGEREEIIRKITEHILAEVKQPEYTSSHGTRSTYSRGCRGLLCRRGNREDLREIQGQQASSRFAVPDELLTEAESRILPGEIIGHVRFSDRVARV